MVVIVRVELVTLYDTQPDIYKKIKMQVDCHHASIADQIKVKSHCDFTLMVALN